MSKVISRSLLALLFLHLAFLVVGQGTQFITGACTSDSVCASGCCGFKSGKCAGPIVAQERDGGCGFGDASPNANAAIALGFHPPASTAAGASTPAATTPATSGSGATAAGTQFITGACTSDSVCASGCCGFKSGKCAGPIVAQERDGGCGFGDASPNANAAIALGFHPPASSAAVGAGTSPPAATASAAAAAKPGASGAGNRAGTQFITGPCTSDADCASKCCGFHSGLCAGPVIAQTRDGGCGFGDAQPNGIAASAFLSGQTATMSTMAAAAAAPAATSNTGAGAGNKAGKQFITGPCTSDADCASGCCGFKSGKCAGAIVAQERDGGCGFGNASPNDTAAQALRGGKLRMRTVPRKYWG